MNEIVSTLGLLMYILAAVSIFTILFVTISKTLKQTPMFNGGGAVAVALGVSLLCMVGLYRTFVEPAAGTTVSRGHAQPWFEFCLLPYTALALAMLSVLLLLLVRRVLLGNRTKSELPPRALATQSPPAKTIKGSSGKGAPTSRPKRPSKSLEKGKGVRTACSDRQTALQTRALNKETLR